MGYRPVSTSGRKLAIIAALAALMFMPLASATAFVPPAHPFLMKTYTMKSNGSISATPLNELLSTAIQGHPKISLRGFVNTTIVRGVSTLRISTGIVKHQKVDVLYYSTTTSTGALVTITSVLVLASNAGYSAEVVAMLTPQKNDLNLGDAFTVGYSNMFSGSLSALASGVGQVAALYDRSGNATLNTLGGYYSTVGSNIKTMQVMLPASISMLVVSLVHAAVVAAPQQK